MQLQRGKRKLFRQLRSSGTESPEDRVGFSQLEADVCWQSAQQLKTAEKSFDEQKDLNRNQGGSRTEQY